MCCTAAGKLNRARTGRGRTFPVHVGVQVQKWAPRRLETSHGLYPGATRWLALPLITLGAKMHPTASSDSAACSIDKHSNCKFHQVCVRV